MKGLCKTLKYDVTRVTTPKYLEQVQVSHR